MCIRDSIWASAYPLTYRGTYEPKLKEFPIIKHELGSNYMSNRGRETKKIFTDHSATLAQDTSSYRPSVQAAQQTAVNTLASNKLPIRSRFPGRSFFDNSKPSAICAVDDHENIDDATDKSEETDEQLAAMTVQSERPTRHLDRPREQERKRRFEGQGHEARSQATKPRRTDYSDKPNTSRFQERRGSSFQRGGAPTPRQQRRRDFKPPVGKLPPDAPQPDGSEEEIKNYIMDSRTCFYHARGECCPSMTEKFFCQYSHAQEPIPWGAYPRKVKFPQEAEMAAIRLEQLMCDIATSASPENPADTHQTDGHQELHALDDDSSYHN